MEYTPFDQQEEFLTDHSRIRLLIAAKRCISPESKVLTLDGVKAFGDISSSDSLLSFDQKAKEFQFHRSTASFPKTKSKGLRVIHERGQFVVSEHHLVFCADYKYRSVQEIQRLLAQGGVGPSVSLLSHENSIEELGQLLCDEGDRHWFEKLSDYMGHCATDVRQYGQQLLRAAEAFPTLFQQIFGAPIFGQQSFQEACVCGGVLGHRKLKHNHHDQHAFQSSTHGVMDPYDFPSGVGRKGPLPLGAFEQYRYLSQLDQLFHRTTYRYQREKKPSLKQIEQSFSLCESRIMRIDQESTQWWWDISVNTTHNYVANGAIHHNSGKSEIAYIDDIIRGHKQTHYKEGPDPYLIGIIAPTENMLRRLVFPKLREFAKPFEESFNKQDLIFKFANRNSYMYGFSAEKIARMEGYKINHIHMTEAFQMDIDVFYEALARLSDTKGTLTIEGSLGTNINNPKLHWIYKQFKEKEFEGARVWEWTTSDNPHFPREELERLKDNLDPRTYRQMFTIDWDVPGTSLVYDEFDEANELIGYQYDPRLETVVAIDWGWAHAMACIFFQYDKRSNTVYAFDEIVSSRLTLEMLWDRIKAKGYNINHWYCDIAGNQEREQTGMSNVKWFRNPPRNIVLRYRSTAINYGIPIVRQFIKNGLGQRNLFVDKNKCPKLLDGIRNYSYQEKNGIIQNENPVKKEDDAVDALRYFVVNHLDPGFDKQPIKEFNRWGKWKT